ncbi:MAG TPA: isoprenyl transferase [Leeuwenhoekiella sp.]|uniref:isoprenyl transferase n=1 Tax=Leeuwenhoekiella palythoae TaxID=573501 RepID=UPI000C645B2F|nr:isoprenyl transferase [Leeuwenhoekiella palythoae]MAS20911.1 di-trans,poly-cis-decaprenylcistransferase [Leeuwenhoekiella sp.]UBZ11506.1 isoprenyl transferase [Leeuwenhoekiella palythoae]HAX14179.1 isoprenyl transferase [Leeuwenhoekiella sp.]HCQ77668.1 isoprenyl transferase [Leeuwenhoekiella sp.]|tara:strand:+ start:1350 stop:2090 length:741 start_codon:yes stop_codon:yes gene_type:complete
MEFLDEIDQHKLPKHIAVIMDGNGRWAKNQGLLRVKGHKKGTKAVRETIEACAELGVAFVTLYAFSTENWNRPKLEVDTLMNLLVSSLKKEIKTLQDNNISLSAIGSLNNLPEKAQRELKEVIEKTKNNTRLKLTLALSYGSREELVKTIQDISHKVKKNLISPHSINESVIKEHLYTHDMPDVDLLIRTSGEQRISNFLLWQIAYAELYFTPVLWPDFTRKHLYEAIYNYQKRERRFGKTSEQIN